MLFLAEHFAVLEPQKPPIQEFYVMKKHISGDYEGLKSCNVWSGCFLFHTHTHSGWWCQLWMVKFLVHNLGWAVKPALLALVGGRRGRGSIQVCLLVGLWVGYFTPTWRPKCSSWRPDSGQDSWSLIGGIRWYKNGGRSFLTTEKTKQFGVIYNLGSIVSRTPGKPETISSILQLNDKGMRNAEYIFSKYFGC